MAAGQGCAAALAVTAPGKVRNFRRQILVFFGLQHPIIDPPWPRRRAPALGRVE